MVWFWTVWTVFKGVSGVSWFKYDGTYETIFKKQTKKNKNRSLAICSTSVNRLVYNKHFKSFRKKIKQKTSPMTGRKKKKRRSRNYLHGETPTVEVCSDVFTSQRPQQIFGKIPE